MQTEMTLDLSFLSLTAAEQAIHDNALNCAQNYRRAEGPLLAAIDAVDRARLADKFRTNTFQYCVEYLKLTPACAYYFQAVARKSREFPELRKAIENDEVSVAKVARVVSVMNEENKEDWMKKARELPKDELEAEVRRAQPEKPKRAVAKPAGKNTTRLAFDADDEFMSLLNRARELESQRTSKKSDIPEALLASLRAFVDRNDPVRKAERAEKRAAKKPAPVVEASAPAEVIPAASRHAVNQRDKGKCRAHLPNGKTCGAADWVEIHHIVRRADGGTHEPENLITLCRMHHEQHHDELRGIVV